MKARKIKALWHSLSSEMTRSAIKGQILHILKPKRYMQAKKIRPKRKPLVREKRETIQKIKEFLELDGVKPIRVFGRIKTLSSIDRKIRRITSGEKGVNLRSDLIGITVLAKSIPECEKILSVLVRRSNPVKPTELFPGIKNAKNPRNFYSKEDKKYRPKSQPTETQYISLYTVFPGISTPVHLNIMRPKDYWTAKSFRGAYLKKLKPN